MSNKIKLFMALTLLVISTLLIFTGCETEAKSVDASSFKINAEKVLIAEKNGDIELGLKIEPSDAYPLDFTFQSSDEKVATATIGAIDDQGNVVTASEMQAKKDELAEKDKKEAEKIVVPTNTAIVTAHGYGECTITGTLGGGLSDDVKVVVADKQVALTFDDGSAPPTENLLDGLEEEDVRATFFVVGSMSKAAQTHTDALKRVIEDGHEVGNHTYNHPIGTTNIDSELKKTDDLIISLGGKKTTVMRPPGGAMNSAIRNCGKAIILWSVDTMDWKYRDAGNVKSGILTAKDGDIVLMHDLYDTSVEGALTAIPELKQKGFYLTTVSDLLGDPKPNTEYKNGEKGQLKTQIIE